MVTAVQGARERYVISRRLVWLWSERDPDYGRWRKQLRCRSLDLIDLQRRSNYEDLMNLANNHDLSTDDRLGNGPTRLIPKRRVQRIDE